MMTHPELIKPRMPLVVFNRIPLEPASVRTLVRLSRHVARWNGNRRGQRAVTIITDDFTLARQALMNVDFKHTNPSLAETNTGLFWPHSGVMWIHPWEERPGATVRTLVHEMAHACVLGVHNRQWRRMYAMLLPLWWRALQPTSTVSGRVSLNLRYELHRVVRYYAAHRMSLSRRREEVDSHIAASQRAVARWTRDIDQDFLVDHK